MEFRNCDGKCPLQKMRNLRETDVWECEPSPWGIFVYSLVIPTISAVGIVGNALILVVLAGKSLKASTYTYLAVLSGADLITCILLLFSGLAKGIFWSKSGWLEFDTFVYLPVCSMSSNVAVLATICVTLDRLILVSGPLRCKPPKFCNTIIARKLMWCTLPVAAVCNIPYFFIYKYDETGTIVTTEFFNSWWYDLNNWLHLSVFGLIPALFILIGNSILLFSMAKVIEKRRALMDTGEGKCMRERTRMTITLVGIVFVFLIGEVPSHLASRRSAITILYGGDPARVHGTFMERFRIWATVLNAISSSTSFVLYCLLSPQFRAHLKDLVTVVRDGPRKNKLKNCEQPPTIQRLESKEGIDF